MKVGLVGEHVYKPNGNEERESERELKIRKPPFGDPQALFLGNSTSQGKIVSSRPVTLRLIWTAKYGWGTPEVGACFEKLASLPIDCKRRTQEQELKRQASIPKGEQLRDHPRIGLALAVICPSQNVCWRVVTKGWNR